uniref:Uncharacterized protein n=1 Tax=Amphimedon queenslandica TaxID=400682 RepID=A0A1X7T442_AMPQE
MVEGDIALIVSARRGDYETVKVLLDNGADPNIGQEWEYPIPLIKAAIEGHTNVVELLLSKGADPNIIDG